MSKSNTPKTIHISPKFLYACLCAFVFTFGAFMIAYGFIGDYYKFRFAPVLRIYPILFGLVVAIQSLNLWFEWPTVYKRYFRPKRYTQLKRERG